VQYEGDLRAALAVIRAGGTRSFAAAYAIPRLSNEDSAPQEFAREGTVRSLVRLCSRALSDKLPEEFLADTALKTCFSKSPEALTQYIAEFSDADPQNVVAAAIIVIKVLHFGSQVRKRLLGDEGFTARIVGLLSARSVYFHSFMVWATVEIVKLWPKKCHGLLKAGLVRQLMRILARGRVQESPQQPHDCTSASLDGCFVSFQGVAAERQQAHEAPYACCGLATLAEKFPQVPQEVFKTQNLASALVSCMKQFAGFEHCQLGLLTSIFGFLDAAATNKNCSFARELVSLGLGEIMLSLISDMEHPAYDIAIRVVCILAVMVDKKHYRLATQRGIVAALVRYIETNGREIGMAGWALTQFDPWKDAIMWSDIAASPALVKTLTRKIITCEPTSFVYFHVPIVELFLHDVGTELLRMAVHAGFVPGALGLLRAEHADSATRRPDDTRLWANFYDRLREGLMQVIALNEPQFIKQAIRCGLLGVAHEAIRHHSGPTHAAIGQYSGWLPEHIYWYSYMGQLFALFCITILAEHPEALEEMRRVGLWPDGFLLLGSSRSGDFMEVYIAVLRRLATHRPSLVTELFAGASVKGSNCLQLLKTSAAGSAVPMQGMLMPHINLLESFLEASKEAAGRPAQNQNLRRDKRVAVRCPEASICLHQYSMYSNKSHVVS
jgi:hypothetical protein